MGECNELLWCEECDYFVDSDMGGEGYCKIKDEPTVYCSPACFEFEMGGCEG